MSKGIHIARFGNFNGLPFDVFIAAYHLQEPMLGNFVFHSSKAARIHDAAQGRCIAYMFSMRVEEELPVWPEQKHRERIWVNFAHNLKARNHFWRSFCSVSEVAKASWIALQSSFWIELCL